MAQGQDLSQIKGYIFDMDGTVLESMSLWDDVYRDLFKKCSLSMPSDYLLATNHLKLEDCVDYTLRNTPVKMTREEIFDFFKQEALDAYENSVELKPYATKLLALIKNRGCKAGIATALGDYLYEPCLKRNGVWSFFHSGTSIDEVGHGKDRPDVYLRECSKLGLRPSQCAVVDDSHIGIASAKAAGFFTIGVYDAASEQYWDELRHNSDIAATSLRQVYYALKNSR